jgi:hypothetical protein
MTSATTGLCFVSYDIVLVMPLLSHPIRTLFHSFMITSRYMLLRSLSTGHVLFLGSSLWYNCNLVLLSLVL